MKFTFDYSEQLTRRVSIDAPSFMDAIDILKNKIDNEEIVLDSSDFVGADIKMPLDKNFLPQLQQCGETVEDIEDVDLLIDFW